MSDFLTEMTEVSLARAREAERHSSSIEARLNEAAPPRPLDVSAPGFDVIAEAKLSSPAEGRLTAGGIERVSELAESYAANGAAAVSVLTEQSKFEGAMEHLHRAASRVDIPVMRKDFLVHPIQVREARAAGASGVLLIARMLPGSLLDEMLDVTLGLGMFALVEVFDRADLEAAARVFDRDLLVGVNCRNLATLEVDFQRFGKLAPHLPKGLPTVAESGIATPADAEAVVALGYRLALVGSSLVSDTEPGARLASLIESGRASLSGVGR